MKIATQAAIRIYTQIEMQIEMKTEMQIEMQTDMQTELQIGMKIGIRIEMHIDSQRINYYFGQGWILNASISNFTIFETHRQKRPYFK